MKGKIATNVVPVSGAHGRLDIGALRELARNEPQAFMAKIQAGIESKKFSIRDITRWDLLYAGLADIRVPVELEMGGATRSILASAFPVITGTTAIAAIAEAYAAWPTIGQDLCQDITDAKKITTIANIHALDKDIDEVKDGHDFPEVGAVEEYAEIRHKLNGRILRLGASLFEENEIADIQGRVNAIGEIAGEWIEEQTLYRVTDYYGSATTPAEPYVYRPNGTGTALFSTTANTPGTRAPSGTRIASNALVDDSDLDNAKTVLNAMKNERGKRIMTPWSEVQLLVPDALIGTAMKILNSEYVPGVENEVSNYGPRGRWFIPPARVHSSPKIDDMSTSAWYLGAFRRQFRRKWKLALEYVTLGTDTQAYLNNRTAFQARIAWDVELGALDYTGVVQNLSGTTAPYNV